MNQHQNNLFGSGVDAYGSELPPPAQPSTLARASDPTSSHTAAQKVVSTGQARGQAAIILEIMGRANRPLTYRELFQFANTEEKTALKEPVGVARRLPQMQKFGQVKPGAERICTVSGNLAREWALVEEDT